LGMDGICSSHVNLIYAYGTTRSPIVANKEQYHDLLYE